jgi:C-terminal peptidase prc
MGMLAGVGDKYTYYLPEESLDQYMENTNGSFDGIGIEVYITQEGEVIIGYVMPNEPAETAGFKNGDVIVGVDGKDTRGLPLSDIAARIRGKAGTEVTLTVYRKDTDETLELTVKRSSVQMHSARGEMIEDGVGYIALSGFKENTYAQFQEELQKLQAEFPSHWLKLIDRLSGYMQSKGVKYTDHLATMRNWGRKDNLNTQPGSVSTAPVMGSLEQEAIRRMLGQEVE